MSLGNFVSLEPDVVQGMGAIASMNINNKYIDLGCGDGQFLELALSLGVKANKVFGVEWDVDLYNICVAKGLNVYNDDVFNLNYSTYDIVSFWFNMGADLTLLFDKLYNELSSGAKIIALHGTRKQYRDGIFVPEESCYDVSTDVGVLPYPTWKPTAQGEVLGNRFYLYVR